MQNSVHADWTLIITGIDANIEYTVVDWTLIIAGIDGNIEYTVTSYWATNLPSKRSWNDTVLVYYFWIDAA